MGLLRTRVEATLEMIHNWESRVIYHRETLRKKALWKFRVRQAFCHARLAQFKWQQQRRRRRKKEAFFQFPLNVEKHIHFSTCIILEKYGTEIPIQVSNHSFIFAEDVFYQVLKIFPSEFQIFWVFLPLYFGCIKNADYGNFTFANSVV